MSEVKFTDDELKSIQEISQKSNEITNRFGQLAIAKINLEKQSEAVEEEDMGEDVEIETSAEDKFTNDLDPAEK